MVACCACTVVCNSATSRCRVAISSARPSTVSRYGADTTRGHGVESPGNLVREDVLKQRGNDLIEQQKLSWMIELQL